MKNKILRMPFYQVDAFATAPFQGNPAALCILESWLDDATMQSIAIENNLAETAYMIPQEGGYAIRWFTNEGEINLCGHATLAAAHVAYERLNFKKDKIIFTTSTGVGDLTVTRRDDLYVMDFPAWPSQPESCPAAIIEGLGGAVPQEAFLHRDYMLVYPDEAVVKNLRPDFIRLGQVDKYVCVTAPGDDCDFVSRFFCAGDAVQEDPVTGSAHCMLAPYWAQRLDKPQLLARQYSQRGAAEILCHVRGDRIELAGRAVTVIEGSFILPLHPNRQAGHSRPEVPGVA